MAALTEKCIFVVGPTASGKSAWALEQAEKHKGSIVNIDSIQLYQNLLIGSAAPTANEKKRVPHLLYNYVAAPAEMTAGGYLRDFHQMIESAPKFPLFIVGGTGFYIQALEKGMFDIEPVPQEIRVAIEKELAVEGPERLFAELKAGDPQSKIHINDHFRLVRAVEILRHSGGIPSELKKSNSEKKNAFPFEFIKVGFDFEKVLYEAPVRKRTAVMIKSGIIEETRALIAGGLADWAPVQSVGYKETVAFLENGKSLEWLADNINQSTMQLIKKQKTWFKRDGTILWSNQEQAVGRFLS